MGVDRTIAGCYRVIRKQSIDKTAVFVIQCFNAKNNYWEYVNDYGSLESAMAALDKEEARLDKATPNVLHKRTLYRAI
jgi:hypothetical protein